MLSPEQIEAARLCLEVRPAVFANDDERCDWYDMVYECMKAHNVATPADINEFCNIAGVAD